MILIDDQLVKFGKFPNGESNLNFNNFQLGNASLVTLKFESDQDLFNLFILKNYMDSCYSQNMFSLEILYMPYSRMDRANSYYTFNLKYVANFINSLNFKAVAVYDPHSDVTMALLNNARELSIIPGLFQEFRNDHSDFVLMYPDAGAQKRYEKYFNYPVVVGSKQRNFETGNITKFDIYGVDVKGKDVVIIDDLCSKGGTFVGAAKALKEQGALNIYLIVGHCENTIFDGEVFQHIEKIYTTNSILSELLVEVQQAESKLQIYKQYHIKKDGY